MKIKPFENIWFYHKSHFIVIPTNLIVKHDGSLVMGAGLAKQAKNKFPNIDHIFGKHHIHSNSPFVCQENRLISLPTKHHFNHPSDLNLIKTGLDFLYEFSLKNKVACTKIGCGLGGLDFNTEVKPLFKKFKRVKDFILVV